jgi:hypothetical protein
LHSNTAGSFAVKLKLALVLLVGFRGFDEMWVCGAVVSAELAAADPAAVMCACAETTVWETPTSTSAATTAASFLTFRPGYLGFQWKPQLLPAFSR